MPAKNPAGSVWLIALIFLAMLSLPLSVINSRHSSRGEAQWVPVALHSILTADYSADPRSNRVPAVKLSLIKDALADQASEDSLRAFDEVQDSLRTPVPSAESGLPRASATAAQPPSTEPSIPPTATPTRSQPTAIRPHPTQTAPPTPTNIILLPSLTPSATKEPTRTSKPPRKPKSTSTAQPTQEPTEPPPTQPPPTKPPTKPPPPDPYPPPPPAPKPTEPYP